MRARLRRAGTWLIRGANLRVVVATMVGLALFGYVVDIASHGDLLGGLGDVLAGVGLISLVLAVPYFALRALTWQLLLVQVGVRSPARQTVAAFCAGEISKSLPLGVYLETYVLARIRHLREREVVGAAVATTGLDVMVGTVTFLVAMAIGLPNNPWFRWLLVAIAGAWIVIYGVVYLLVRWWQRHPGNAESRLGRAVIRILGEAVRGATRLIRPAVVAPLGTTVAYLAIYVAVAWLVLDALGFGSLGIGAAVTMVVITSLANVMLPIPIELGITEITGVGILGAFGVDARDAAIVMLSYRVVTTGALTIVILVVLVAVRSAFTTQPDQAPRIARAG
jgi:Lysylphosphatidylglycerol synthase TM region